VALGEGETINALSLSARTRRLFREDRQWPRQGGEAARENGLRK
jgi:hypothetical protein